MEMHKHCVHRPHTIIPIFASPIDPLAQYQSDVTYPPEGWAAIAQSHHIDIHPLIFIQRIFRAREVILRDSCHFSRQQKSYWTSGDALQAKYKAQNVIKTFLLSSPKTCLSGMVSETYPSAFRSEDDAGICNNEPICDTQLLSWRLRTSEQKILRDSCFAISS
ncbi:unnamed protein product [Somion occarium]|uniref:Uncharacterized protein n=1 Tax=Somion occarium TaxID=3059160 RepID=A0ABP1CHQ0_9APHY